MYSLHEKGAKQAGLLHQSLRDEGTPMDPEDCVIAAIALEHNRMLVTRNIFHVY